METWITYISAVIVVIGVSLTVWSKIREHREDRRGWRTSFDTFGLRYAEKKEGGRWDSLLIRATLRGHGLGDLLIPSESVWNSRHPEWARGRREEIIARVRTEAQALSFLEEPIQSPEPMSGLAPGHGTSLTFDKTPS